MGKTYRYSCKKYIQCPQCGSVFVDWDMQTRRWRCLVYKCGWVEDEESDPGCWNPITGSCQYGYGEGHIEGEQICYISQEPKTYISKK
jgi:hypothetical protein